MSKYTRKGEIDKILEGVECRWGYMERHRNWLRGVLDRFGKKERNEVHRQNIAAYTKAIQNRSVKPGSLWRVHKDAPTLRVERVVKDERGREVAYLEGGVGVLVARLRAQWTEVKVI